jgi:hypothetical protein
MKKIKKIPILKISIKIQNLSASLTKLKVVLSTNLALILMEIISLLKSMTTPLTAR